MARKNLRILSLYPRRGKKSANSIIKKLKRSPLQVNLLLVALVIVITVFPLLVAKDAEFGGADAKAEEAISEIMPNYIPWFSPLFSPASSEIESLMFALQAALGAGVIGYGLGYLKGRKK